MKKTSFLLAYPDRWIRVDAYEAFTYEGHTFYVHHPRIGEGFFDHDNNLRRKWRVSHSCGAAASHLHSTRQQAIDECLATMKARGIDRTQLNQMAASTLRQMEGKVKP